MEDRFEYTEYEKLYHGRALIIVDKETGVQYLLAGRGDYSGLTVMVDQDGKPLLDPKYAK
ncbi:MAG: DUF6440 family protein [bacterium]